MRVGLRFVKIFTFPSEKAIRPGVYLLLNLPLGHAWEKTFQFSFRTDPPIAFLVASPEVTFSAIEEHRIIKSSHRPATMTTAQTRLLATKPPTYYDLTGTAVAKVTPEKRGLFAALISTRRLANWAFFQSP